MKQIILKLGKLVVAFSMVITTISVNSTCPFLTYQPVVPKNANKLRKFDKNDME